MTALNKNLIKGSLVLLIAFGLFNFFHFLFQFFMARMLSIEEYGVLASLFALIYITLILTEAVQTIITKYSAKENNKSRLKNLFIKSHNKALVFSSILFVIYLVIAVPLSFMLKINYLLLALNGLVVFLAFLLPISRGIMQGKKRFKSLGANITIESFTKLILGVLLVFLGLKVYGAILGVLLGGVIAYLFSFFQLKDIIKSKQKKARISGIYQYAKPTFIITAIIVVFYSLDVVLARIFFSPETAGIYAIASILGKIIFWGTLPISKVMFPMSASSENQKKKKENIFANAFSIVLLGVLGALLIFYLFPEIIIKIFSGKVIPEASSILIYVGIAFSFISIANLVLLHKLSIGKIKGYHYLSVFIIVEIIILSFFTNNLFQFSIAFITASAAFLWASVVLVGNND